MPHETDLEMAARHVRQGERNVAQQSALVEELRVDGHDAAQAEELLTEFEAILAQHKAHLALLRSKAKSTGNRNPHGLCAMAARQNSAN